MLINLLGYYNVSLLRSPKFCKMKKGVPVSNAPPKIQRARGSRPEGHSRHLTIKDSPIRSRLGKPQWRDFIPHPREGGGNVANSTSKYSPSCIIEANHAFALEISNGNPRNEIMNSDFMWSAFKADEARMRFWQTISYSEPHTTRSVRTTIINENF